MSRLETDVAFLNLSEGERQSRLGNMRAVEPLPSSPQAIAKGSLYVLVELSGERPASPRLHRLLLNTIQGVYYDAAGGISGGITEAILAAHRALQEHNALHPEAVQWGGVSCVVLRGEELYVGVGGPALALIGHPARIEQFPAELTPDRVPLGGQETPSVELFRGRLEKEVLVIQMESAWLVRVPPRKLAAAALADDVETAQEYLEALAPPTAELSALVLHITRQPKPEEAVPTEGEQAEAALEEAPDESPVTEGMVSSSEGEIEAQAEPAAAVAAAEEHAAAAKVAAEEMLAAEGGKRRRLWLWLLLILLPLLVVATIGGVWWWQQRSLQLQFGSLLQGTEAALQAATAEGVPEVTARAQLADARERIQEALRIRPGDPQALELEQSIQKALDRLNRVVPLYKLITLQPLGGAGSEPARVLVQNNRVYVLDRGLDQVLRFTMSELSGLIPQPGEDVLAQRGQTLADGQLVGEILDIAWIPAGGLRTTSRLVLLDSNRNLLEVDEPLGLKSLEVADREQWQAPRLAAGYNGNFYLLDSGLGRILRYLPDGSGGYSNAPENYFGDDVALDLTRVVDMAIDGNIWLLYSDGTVQTFFRGQQQPFELETPPDGPITQPQAIYAGAEAGTAQHLYIADSGGGRILEYDKQGNYLRQFRPADKLDQEKMRRMRALQVDEIERSFYILTSDALLRTDIPDLP